MEYITGIHALNLSCSLLTCGDWHQSALKWEKLTYRNTEDSIFGEYGIEQCSVVPEHQGTYAVANHIRALLDLIEIGNFAVAQGMNEDFICNDDYTEEIFEMVTKMNNLPYWNKIDEFMGRKYHSKWLNHKRNSEMDKDSTPR